MAIISPGDRRVLNQHSQTALKKYASRYYHLKVGHGAEGTFLARIGVIEIPERWWWFGATKQTVDYLYARCRKCSKQRRKLLRELEKEGIKWQPRVVNNVLYLQPLLVTKGNNL